jgi:hypothetical protein
MKNFLKVQPDEYVKERAIGKTSFIIRQAIVIALFLVPLNLLVWYFLSHNTSVGINILNSMMISVGLSIIEWASLEYNYWKNERRKD